MRATRVGDVSVLCQRAPTSQSVAPSRQRQWQCCRECCVHECCARARGNAQSADRRTHGASERERRAPRHLRALREHKPRSAVAQQLGRGDARRRVWRDGGRGGGVCVQCSRQREEEYECRRAPLFGAEREKGWRHATSAKCLTGRYRVPGATSNKRGDGGAARLVALRRLAAELPCQPMYSNSVTVPALLRVCTFSYLLKLLRYSLYACKRPEQCCMQAGSRVPGCCGGADVARHARCCARGARSRVTVKPRGTPPVVLTACFLRWPHFRFVIKKSAE